jgi:hypothetical protein
MSEVSKGPTWKREGPEVGRDARELKVRGGTAVELQVGRAEC